MQGTKRASVVVAVAAVAVLGCRGPAPSGPIGPQPSTRFYAGTVQMRGVDGDLWIDGETTLRREVRPSQATIVETWMVNGAPVTTTMVRTGDGAVFAASDERSGVGGTVTFAGDPWVSTSWTYQLQIIDDEGTITGTGRLGETTLTTRKEYLLPDGTLNATLEERVLLVTEQEYDAKRKQLTTP